MKVCMIQNIALNEKVVKTKESVIRLSDGHDTRAMVISGVCVADGWIEYKGLQLDGYQQRVFVALHDR
jgi:hypothetical protein